MYAVLGDILFVTLTSPAAFESARAFDYAEHKVVQAPPRLQWTANALETITLDLNFHVAFTNPQTQLNTLNAAAKDHQARALVFGNGIHRGYFVIVSIAETQKHQADDGSMIWASAKVELKQWIPGADFDPLAPPRPRTPPPAIVPTPSSSTAASATPFNPNQPIGPHNLLPTAAILTLGALPANTYTPPGYPNAGVSAGVSNPAGPVAPGNLNYGTVPASTAVRAAP